MLRIFKTIVISTAMLFCAQGVQAASMPSPPDFNFDTAFPTPLSGSYSGEADLPGVASPNNIAWFQFTLSGLSNVNLDTFGSGILDTVLALYDSSGAIVGQNDDCGSPTSFQSCLTLTNLVSDTYLAGILKFSSDEDGNAAIFVNMWEATASSADDTPTARLNLDISAVPIGAVPVPAAVWLFGTALIGFVGMSRRTSVKT